MARRPSDAKPFPRLTMPSGVLPSGAPFNRDAEVIHGQLNGRISLGTKMNAWSGHLDGELIEFTAPSANTDFPVTHNLGRIPLGWLPVSGDGLSRLNSTPAHTVRQLWLRSSSAGRRFRVLAF